MFSGQGSLIFFSLMLWPMSSSIQHCYDDHTLLYECLLGQPVQEILYDPILHVTGLPEDDKDMSFNKDTGVINIHSREQLLESTEGDRGLGALIFIGDYTGLKQWNLSYVVEACAHCEYIMPYWAINELLADVVRLDSRIFLYKREGNETTLSIYEVYTLPREPELIVNHIGRWASRDEWIQHESGSIWDRRSDLRGITIKVATKDSSSGAVKFDPVRSEYYGPFIDIVVALSQRLNFTPEFCTSSDSEWGARLANGSWNGIVGMVARGEVDMIMTSISVTIERSQVMKFGPVLVETVLGFTMIRPGSLGTVDVYAYLLVFTTEAWIVSIVSVIVLGALVALLGMFHGHNLRTSVYVATQQSLKATILRADVPTKSDYPSGRLNIIIMSLLTSLLFQFYAGSLTSYMTANTPPTLIKSFRELFDKEYELYALRSSSLSAALEHAQQGTGMYDFFNKRMKSTNFKSDTELFSQAVIDDPKAAIMVNGFAILPTDEFIFSHGIEDGIRDAWAPGFEIGSQIEPLFSYHIFKMKQSGLIDIILKKNDFIPAMPEWRSPISEPFQLKFVHVTFIWLLLSVGCVVAGLIAFVEKVHRAIAK